MTELIQFSESLLNIFYKHFLCSTCGKNKQNGLYCYNSDQKKKRIKIHFEKEKENIWLMSNAVSQVKMSSVKCRQIDGHSSLYQNSL